MAGLAVGFVLLVCAAVRARSAWLRRAREARAEAEFQKMRAETIDAYRPVASAWSRYMREHRR